MTHNATLVYDTSLIREAAFCFWRRTVGWLFLVALSLVTVSLFAFLMKGDRSWLVGVLGSVLVIGCGFVIAIFAVHYRNAMRKFQKMSSYAATLVATETSFTFSSDLGSSTLPWAAVTEVWRCKRVWLLLFSKAQFVTLPLAALSPELQGFVLKQVQLHGGKVT
jgi:hypothetical protein